ncbi:Fused isobutyryl-CoA mutase [subsurface metagenome]
MTINAPAAVLLAMYIAVAEKQGYKKDQLRGTIQNDILKEYIARGTYIFPPGPSMRVITNTFQVLEAAGYDTIIIETIGVGQTEVEIIELSDIVLLVLVPGMGDEIQVMKAGVMEIGDIFVINKKDIDGAEKLKGGNNGKRICYGHYNHTFRGERG